MGRRARLATFLIGVAPPRHWMQFFPNDEVNVDPTTFWAPSEACTEEMMRLCGFCDIRKISSRHRRAVFHGFSPAHGNDAERLIAAGRAELVADAATQVLKRPVAASDVLATLKDASVVEFGNIRQRASELSAKNWHQRGRWQSKWM